MVGYFEVQALKAERIKKEKKVKVSGL